MRKAISRIGVNGVVASAPTARSTAGHHSMERAFTRTGQRRSVVRRTQHPEMAAARDLHRVGPASPTAAGRPLLRTGRFAYGVGKRFQVVTAGPGRGRGVEEPDDLPATRGGEALGVLGAQVVAVGFGVGGERAEDRGRVGVDVRQRRDGGTAASGARTATYRAHDVGRYRTLERAATTPPQVAPPCRVVKRPTHHFGHTGPDLHGQRRPRDRAVLKAVTTWHKPWQLPCGRRSRRDMESSPTLA